VEEEASEQPSLHLKHLMPLAWQRSVNVVHRAADAVGRVLAATPWVAGNRHRQHPQGHQLWEPCPAFETSGGGRLPLPVQDTPVPHRRVAAKVGRELLRLVLLRGTPLLPQNWRYQAGVPVPHGHPCLGHPRVWHDQRRR